MTLTPKDARTAMITVLEDHGVSWWDDERPHQQPRLGYRYGEKERRQAYGIPKDKKYIDQLVQYVRTGMRQMGVNVSNGKNYSRRESKGPEVGTVVLSDDTTLNGSVNGDGVMLENNQTETVAEDSESNATVFTTQSESVSPEQADQPHVETHTSDRYILFTAKEFQPRVTVEPTAEPLIAIRFREDLLIEKGSVLVFPMDRPQHYDHYSYEEFRLKYRTRVAGDNQQLDRAISQAPSHPTPLPALEEQLTAKNGSDPGLSHGKNPQNGAEKDVSVSRARFPIATATDGDYGKESSMDSHAVTPNLGRLMNAMLYLREAENLPHVTAADMKRFLAPSDARNVYIAIATGEKHKWISRSRASADTRHRLQFSLTDVGISIAWLLGRKPYTSQKMAVPEWLRDLLLRKHG